MFKEVVKKTVLYPLFLAGRGWLEFFGWKLGGMQSYPPSYAKYIIIKEFGRHLGLVVLVETGTYLGGAIMATKNVFKEIYSIELSSEFANRAKDLFRRYAHVHILEGDSAIMLQGVLNRTSGPYLFWLDAHYSGGNTAHAGVSTPISKEVQLILDQWVPGSVMLIDDARLFNGTNGYPNISDLEKEILKERKNFCVQVKHDIIRIYEDDQKKLIQRLL